MASAPSALKRKALALGALLAVTAGVIYGLRMETATQVVLPPQSAPSLLPVASAASAPSAAETDALQALIDKVAPSAPASAPLAMPGPATPVAGDDDISALRTRALALPVQGIAAAQLSDTYTQSRAAGRPHEAIDIMAARGTPVLAVEDGQVVKLFLSKPGGITIYQFDPSRQYAYYYAHLDRYADGLAEGVPLRKGQLIGYVGSTGNASAEAPHLHFAVFKLGPEREWWKGTPLNPFLLWRDAKP